MKLLFIFLWWLLTINAGVYIMFTLPDHFKPERDLPQNHLRLLDFMHAHERYLALDDTSEGRVVIVGPSYGESLYPTPSKIIMGSLRPREGLELVKRCRPQDIVLYPITYREVLMGSTAPRSFVTSPFLRRLTLSRISIKYRLGLIGSGTWRDFLPEVSEDDQLYLSFAKDLPRGQIPLMWKTIRNYSHGRSSYDMHGLWQIYQAHPNVVFVLCPTFPLPDVDNKGFGEYINITSQRMTRFRQAALHQSWRIIDLTGCAREEDFVDFHHFKKRAKERMGRVIQRGLEKMEFPAKHDGTPSTQKSVSVHVTDVCQRKVPAAVEIL